MPEWKKGTSGNPRGRPLGTNEIGKLRAGLAEHVPDIIEAMVAAAKNGDTAAARLLLERVVPALKNEEMPIKLRGLTGSREEQCARILRLMLSGKLDVDRGARLIAALTPGALEERIEALERAVRGGNYE